MYCVFTDLYIVMLHVDCIKYNQILKLICFKCSLLNFIM